MKVIYQQSFVKSHNSGPLEPGIEPMTSLDWKCILGSFHLFFHPVSQMLLKTPLTEEKRFKREKYLEN